MRTSKIERRIGRSNCDMLASKKPDAKASEKFYTPAYQSYSGEDYLRKMGVDITKGVDSIGTDDQGKTDGIQKQ